MKWLSCVCLQEILPVDQASNSDANNVSSSHSDISLSGDLQDLSRSIEVVEAEPLRSNEGNDSDGCVVVGYVKPRHERTPEIITLLSSEPEAEEGDVIVSRSLSELSFYGVLTQSCMATAWWYLSRVYCQVSVHKSKLHGWSMLQGFTTLISPT